MSGPESLGGVDDGLPGPAEARRQRFFRAVKESDRVGTAMLLKADPELVHAYDPDAYDGTALNIAASLGDLEMVDLLLEHGGDINRKSGWWAGGFAPIHSIFWSRHHEMGPALIERGAIVDAHAAAGLGMRDRLESLLNDDPGLVDEPGGDGQLPLHFAATPEIAELLLARGAAIDARDVDHEGTAAQWAARSRPDVARYLIARGAEVDPFLLVAAGETDRLSTLLAADPGILGWRIDAEHFPTTGSEALHIYGYTLGWEASLLHVAARCDRPEMVELLIDGGFDPGTRADYDDCTALHTAAWEGSLGAAEALLDRGAPIDVASGATHENEPLGWAVVSGQLDMVTLLLDRGAPIRPHHREQAARGAMGDFRQWSGSPLKAWERIADLLAAVPGESSDGAEVSS